MSDVETEVIGRLGLITLNRPQAINALTHDMVRVVDATLRSWSGDPAVAQVAIRGAGGRGLCAGGDIRAIYEDASAGGGSASLAFWADEYRMNALVARYPKPYVALMDGLVMGGGVGVSAHGSHRVVTGRTKIAMPEVGIGFTPDVGGSFLLSRAPGELGTHLALTGLGVDGPDAIAAGLADHLVPDDQLDALVDGLAARPVDDVLADLAVEPGPSALRDAAGWIDRCYRGSSAEEVLARLDAEGAEETGPADAAARIRRASPTSVKVTLAALRRAADLPDLEAALVQEYRVSTRMLSTPDLREGIRAQIIDRDRNPSWSPASLTDVGDDLVASYFTDLGDDELVVAA